MKTVPSSGSGVTKAALSELGSAPRLGVGGGIYRYTPVATPGTSAPPAVRVELIQSRECSDQRLHSEIQIFKFSGSHKRRILTE